MADPTDTQTPLPADPYDPAALQRILQMITPPRPQMPDSGQGRSVVGLLGDALSGGGAGGTAGLSDDQYNQAGRSALLNAGISMLRGSSGYQAAPRSLGGIVAGGLEAAQQGETQSEAVAAARQADMLDQWQEEKKTRLGALGEVGKMQELQLAMRRLQALQGIKFPWETASGQGGQGGQGAPGDYASAIGSIEGGPEKNPRSNASGYGQFIPSTWNEFASANPTLFAGMSPQQILDARSNPALGAQATTWLAQRNAGQLQAAGVTPSGTSLGVAHYLGAGPAARVMQADPNAAVAQFVSKDALDANPELAKMTAGQLRARYAGVPDPDFLKPQGGRTAAAPPPAPTATAPPAGPPPIPNDASSGPTGAQFAGPGAVAGPVAPPGPAVAGDVGAIAAGMTGAGANAGTLAPGGAPPGPPGTQVASAVTPTPLNPPPGTVPMTPETVPNTLEEFQRQHPITVPPEMQHLFSATPDPAQMASVQSAIQSAQQQMVTARASGDLSALGTATTAYQKALADQNTLRENAAKLGRDAETAYMKDQDAARTNIYNELLKAKVASSAADKAQQYKLDEIKATGLQQQQTSAEAARLAEQQKRIASLDDDAKGAGEGINQLTLMSELSHAAGASSVLPQDAKDWMVRMHIAPQATIEKWSAQQALDEAGSRLIPLLRAGTGFQRVTDSDLRLLQQAGPGNSMTPEQFRDARTAALMSALQRTKNFSQQVSSFMSTGMSFPDATKAADDALGPIIKQVPDAATLAKTYNGDPNARGLWLQHTIDPGTFYKDEHGGLRRRPMPGETPPPRTAAP